MAGIRWPLLLLLSISVGVFATPKKYDRYLLLKVTPQSTQHLAWLLRLSERRSDTVDLWSEVKGVGKDVTLMISPSFTASIMSQMEMTKLPYTVVTTSVQEMIDEVEADNVDAMGAYPPGLGIGHGYDYTHYMKYSQIELWIDSMIKTSINCETVLTCEDKIIGKTHEGRNQHVIKISSGGSGKMKAWIDGGIHAREWISPAVAMYITERLINDYHKDAEVTKMLDTYDFYILPVINADGYQYTHDEDRMWRKSRTLHEGDQCYGTDINRNFDHMWESNVGSSRISCNSAYKGPSLHSEVESKNMADFILNMKGEWEIYLTLHSFGQLWMAPWGCCEEPPETYDELIRVGQAGVDALEAVWGTEYELGSAREILYASTGTSRDWAYGTAEIPYVFTLELRDTGAYGFILPPEQIKPTVEETWAGFRAMTKAIIEGPRIP